MNKGELVDKICQSNNLTKEETKDTLDLIVKSIVEKVKSGEKVTLVNFGTFKPSPRRSTNKVHPVTGEKIDVPAKVVPKFSSGKRFDQLVDESLETVKDGKGKLTFKRK